MPCLTNIQPKDSLFQARTPYPLRALILHVYTYVCTHNSLPLYIYMYVCMYVCMDVCMYVCMYVYNMCILIYIYIYIYIHIHTYIHIYIYIRFVRFCKSVSESPSEGFHAMMRRGDQRNTSELPISLEFAPTAAILV